MRLAKRVVGVCAAFALAAAPFGADAKGGRGGGGRSGSAGGHHGHHSSAHHSSGHHTSVSHGSSFHHGHSYSGVFVGASFAFWPAAYYWPDYYPGAVPAVEYWYYCQPYAAYYPYVQECPTGWQPVLPTAPSPDEYIER